MLRQAARVCSRLLFDVRVEGLGSVSSRGGYIVAGVPHRNWSEPFLMLGLLPRRPVWIADRHAVTGSWLRAAAARAAGGAIAVGRGGDGFEAVVAQVVRSADARRAIVIFPESGQPARPPALRTLSPGLAHLSARARVPVVPVVFGGTHELYLRRRLLVRVLPPIAPPENTSRPSMRAWMARFEETVSGPAAGAHQSAGLKKSRWKVGRWLTGRYPRVD